MPKGSKRYNKIIEKIDKNKDYSIKDACKLIKETLSVAKFDESIDLAINLGIDSRHADQAIRGSIVLPNGTGKKVKVAVFAKGNKAAEAAEAGADIVGGEELIDKIKNGFLAFDKVICVPDLMLALSKIGRVLGPRGLMPNPKMGTVTVDVGKAVKELKGGRVEFKTDKGGVVHLPIGRGSFSVEKIEDNIKTALNSILKARPISVKGTYVKKLSVSPTMGPGIKVSLSSITTI